MITLGAKLYFGIAAFALVAAAVLGFATDASVLGILSFGWSGPIGDQLGYTVLLGLALASFFMGVVTTAFRDADATAVTQVAGTETLPAPTPPAGLSPWPVVAAFSVALLVIGLVVQPLLFGLGVLLVLISALEWTATAWADRATGDPVANLAIRNRLMVPVEIPGAALLGIATFVFFASRVLLSLSKWGSIAVFAVAAIAIIAVASLIATRPATSRSVITAVLLVGGVSLLAGGIVGISAGERDFHQLGEHGDDGTGHADDAADEQIETETGSGSDNDAVTDTTDGDTEG
ncbi:MAG: hypothetical protein JJE52_02285 [Acidimicrobiia bacterium]|nr:hypothetical protein [Acidimicrobiia bacterium]